jgi:hypothetical protein
MFDHVRGSPRPASNIPLPSPIRGTGPGGAPHGPPQSLARGTRATTSISATQPGSNRSQIKTVKAGSWPKHLAAPEHAEAEDAGVRRLSRRQTSSRNTISVESDFLGPNFRMRV